MIPMTFLLWAMGFRCVVAADITKLTFLVNYLGRRRSETLSGFS
jgi:hypothetical protein